MLFKRKYNFWLQKEIDECEKYGYDLAQYINYNTHPLHAKQIKIALIDELSPTQIKEISKIKYKNENEIIDKRNYFSINPDYNYMLNKFMPDTVHYNPKNIDNKDVLYGTILGDIIGQPYEFVEHAQINELITSKNFFTDDTVLSIATMSAILKNEKDPDYKAEYLKFYKLYPRAGYGSSFVNWAINQNTNGYGSWADGSAMRVSFIGTYYNDIKQVIKNAYNSAIITHNHIDGVKGAIITAVVIWMCKNKYTKEEIKEYVYKHYAYDEELLKIKTTGYTHFNLKNPQNNKFKKDGVISCNFAVPYAIYCFLETNSYEECMFKILSNFCDADTICAISGGIAQAYYNNDIENKKKIIKEKLTQDLILCIF